MNAPHISIIIPLYNRESLVVETLDSISAQTFTDWECIVVDDHSTDDSVAVVQKYAEKDPRVKLLIRPDDAPKGACTCRNFGFENSKGDLVYFFDSDDLLSPQFLETVEKKMTENPQVEYGAFAIQHFVDDIEKPYRTTRPFRDDHGSLFHQIVSNCIQINTPSVIWRRELLNRAATIGVRWNECLPRGQESDYFGHLFGIADEGVWFEFPPMVHARAHLKSIGGQFAVVTNELAQLTLQNKIALYDFYLQVGKMTPTLHRIMMWKLFRFQAICVLTSGYIGVSWKYVREIYSRNKRTPYDLCVLLFSTTLLIVGPILYFTSSRLGKIGVPYFKSFHQRCT